MFNRLQIYDPRDRFMVGCADTFLKGYAALARALPSRPRPDVPRRILLLRLERIGDLLMTLGAIDAVRQRAPGAKIHLVVGSWNASLAGLLPGIDSRETVSVPWLARHDAGLSQVELIRRAWTWRSQNFDVALNFEPDVRSNVLLALSGAPRRVGFSSGGGGALLTHALAYDPATHTASNALRIVEAAFPSTHENASSTSAHPRLSLPAEARQQAGQLLANGSTAGRPLIGVHASGGKLIKQWHMDRFAQVATRLSRDLGAAIVLTGTTEDRPLVDRVASALPADVPRLDLAGSMELPIFAGLLERLSLLVTCDTGPMHLAAAVGTPVVALFGPSDPRRYGPLTEKARIVTADLWCRPCNRVRLPPSRCVGHVPDCLERIDVDRVYEAARALLSSSS